MRQILWVTLALLFTKAAPSSAQWVHQGAFPNSSFSGGMGCHGLAVDPEGKIWVQLYGPTDSLYDGAGYRKVHQIFVFMPDGTPAPFSGFKVISCSTGSGVVRDTLYASGRGMRAAADGNILIASDDALYKVDYRTGTGLGKVIPLPGLFLTTPAVSGNGTIYTAQVFLDNKVKMYDAGLTLIRTVVDKSPGYSRSFEVTFDGATIYWAGYTNHAVYRYSAQNPLSSPFILQDTVLKGFDAESFAWNPRTRYLWVSAGSYYDMPNRFPGVTTNYKPGCWYAFDPATGLLRDSLEWVFSAPGNGDERPRAIAFSPGGDTAYVGVFGNSTYPCVRMYTAKRTSSYVTFMMNAATVPDTIKAGAPVVITGADAILTNWGAGVPLRYVRGDYWGITLSFPSSTRLHYKFRIGAGGWEENLGTTDGNRQFWVPAHDTTLPVQFWNNGRMPAGTNPPLDAKPWTPVSDEFVSVWFRVNLLRVMNAGSYGWTPGDVDSVCVMGGTEPLNWNTPVYLRAEQAPTNSASAFPMPPGSFFSGCVSFRKNLAGTQIPYKFRLGANWQRGTLERSEQIGPDRVFTLPSRDTTLHWVWFANEPPGAVVPPRTLTVTEPPAGVSWSVGSKQPVRWTSQNVSGDITVKLSTDGGTTFPASLGSTATVGTGGALTITVPDKPSTTCRVKVELASDASVYGLNPGNFAIAALPKKPQLLAPLNGSAEQPLALAFKWKPGLAGSSYTIRVSDSSGVVVARQSGTYAAGVDTASLSLGTFLYAMTYAWMVSEAQGGPGTVNSDTWTFRTMERPAIAVTAPLAADVWKVGSPQTAAWSSRNVAGVVILKLSTDGGGTFPVTLATADATAGTAAFTVPDYPSVICRLKVESANDPAVFGINPGAFAIVPAPFITVTSPSAGATWVTGSQQQVTWTSKNVSGNVNVSLSVDGGNHFLGNTLVTADANAGSAAMTVLNNPSTACRVKVESANDPLVYGMSQGTFTIAAETTPPTITPPAITGGAANQLIVVRAQITDNMGVASATLHYRRGGTASFGVIPMTPSGGNYEGTISAADVTCNGVDYYVKALDSCGNAARFPATGWSSVQVAVTGSGLVKGKVQPGGSEETAYRLVSIPLQADNSTAGTVLLDDLGGYDKTKWRLFDLTADQSYKEYPDVSPMTPGKAFWLIVKDEGKFIGTGSGKSVPTSSPYSIPLHAGWNLVGNPYPFQLPVSKLSWGSTGPIVLRSYEGAWNSTVTNPVTVMEPFEGYALNASNATTLDVSGDMSVGPLPKAAASTLWWLGIEARCGQARDLDNVAMVAEGASLRRDTLDLLEPPVIGSYVSVSFPHPDWDKCAGSYCVDARPESEQGEVWEFEVRTANGNRVRLDFTSVDRVPQGNEVWLLDEATLARQDLRLKPSYEFPAPGVEKGRRFALVVGSPAKVRELMARIGAVPSTFTLLPNFPNPFNPKTSIPFGVPRSCRVRLDVYTVLGQVVAVLWDGFVEAGFHVVEFDGTDHATGVYLVRLHADGPAGERSLFTRRIMLVR